MIAVLNYINYSRMCAKSIFGWNHWLVRVFICLTVLFGYINYYVILLIDSVMVFMPVFASFYIYTCKCVFCLKV